MPIRKKARRVWPSAEQQEVMKLRSQTGQRLGRSGPGRIGIPSQIVKESKDQRGVAQRPVLVLHFFQSQRKLQLQFYFIRIDKITETCHVVSVAHHEDPQAFHDQNDKKITQFLSVADVQFQFHDGGEALEASQRDFQHSDLAKNTLEDDVMSKNKRGNEINHFVYVAQM